MEFIKKYKIILTTQAPIHIGNGHMVSKKDYLVINDKIVIVDHNDLIEFAINRQLLDSLEQYYKNYKMTLKQWCITNNIREQEIHEIAQYTIDIDTDIKKSNIRNINSFIKDAYNLPYVPGSSLKGVLKNCIFSYELDRIRNLENEKSSIEEGILRARNKNQVNKNLGRVSNTIQSKIFKGRKYELSNDNIDENFMKYIKISDSKPVQKEDLTVCERIDSFVNKPDINLPIYLECIKPNTTIEFDMNIDCESASFIDKAYILDAINSTLDVYNEKHLSNFTKISSCKENIIYVGGATGFHTKTILKNIYDKAELVTITSGILDKAAPRHNHRNDCKLKASPRTVKINKLNNSINQMGACKIEIVPL